MKNQDYENIINGIRTKVGDEMSALIADDLTTLISDNSNMNSQIENKDKEIDKLKSDKENLIKANGNLFQQITMGEEKEEKEKPEEEFSFYDMFDDNGNFIK